VAHESDSRHITYAHDTPKKFAAVYVSRLRDLDSGDGFVVGSSRMQVL
jgi:hypothetical protein